MVVVVIGIEAEEETIGILLLTHHDLIPGYHYRSHDKKDSASRKSSHYYRQDPESWNGRRY